MILQCLQRQRWLVIFVIGGLVGFSACASVPPPIGTLSRAEHAVQGAEQSKAHQYAALELQLARESLDHAKQAMQRNEYKTAGRLAEKALVEAELAEDKAMAANTRVTVNDLRESIEALRDEISRASRK
jgi:hypothetical protein